MSSNRTSRALRRFHRSRYLNKAIKQIQHQQWWTDEYSKSEIRLQASKIANNRAVCSCMMCRNERHCTWISKWEQLTMAERKAKIDFDQQLVDIYDTFM